MATSRRRRLPLSTSLFAALGAAACVCAVALAAGPFAAAPEPTLAGSASWTLLRPFVAAGAAGRDFLQSIQGALGRGGALAEENAALRAALAEARLDEAREDALAARAEARQQASTWVPEGSLALEPAAVLAGPAPRGPRVLWIAGGQGSGWAVGQVVLSSGGVIGVIDRVTPEAAMVRLVTDEKSAWGAEIDGRGELGLVRGTGRPQEVEFLFERTTTEVAVGDAAVTSGRAGSAPLGGIPFGDVVELRKNKRGEPVAVLRLAEDPEALRTVFVLGARRLPREFKP